MPYMSEFKPCFPLDVDDLGKCHGFVRRIFPNETRRLNGVATPVTPLFYRNGNKFLSVSNSLPVVMPEVSIKSKAFNPKVENEWVIPFQLKANPVVTRKKSRVGLSSEKDQLEWLKRALANSGCEVIKSMVVCSGVESGVHRPGQAPMTFMGVVFRGMLRVKDKDKMGQALLNGLGRGKAYGFGMLLLGG